MGTMTATRTETIPDFRLPASTGQTLERASFMGKVPMVISFHPGFSHPGTGVLIASFNELLSDFGAQRSQVLIVVPETAADVRAYAAEHHISLPLLADPGHGMARAFDAFNDDEIVEPVLIVTDVNGVVVCRFDEAPEEGQAQAALRAIRGEGSGAPEPEHGSTDS